MANEEVIRHHLWLSWEYEKEEQWINDMSAKGLHLKKAGLMRSKFIRDASVRYTYRLDYQTGLGKGEKWEEYLALYRDAGWEYAGSYGLMWHYFRMPWQPGESPKLYTDRESLVAHYKRLRQVMVLMLAVNLLLLLTNSVNLLPRADNHLRGIIIPVFAIYVSIFLMLGIGIVKINRKIK